MAFLFRPCGERLDDAMRKVVTLDSWDALAAHIAPLRLASVEAYGFDERIGWNTYIVVAEYADGVRGPCGFTNGPV
jgi:hypothetical protein